MDKKTKAANVQQKPTGGIANVFVPTNAPSSSSSHPPLVVQPGIGLASFKLGASIGSILTQIQHNARCYFDVDITSDTTHPLSHDISVDIRSIGVRLRFHPSNQRLTLIDIYDIRTNITYMKSNITKPATTLTNLYSIFGPTFQGELDHTNDIYLLQYPGVALSFHIPGGVPESQLQNGVASITLSDGSSPIMQRMLIHAASQPVHSHSTSLPTLLPSESYFEPITVHMNRGLSFERRGGAIITFDSYAQDLLSELGAPQNVYLKQSEQDKMQIHRDSSHSVASDYFFNYYLMGLDVLLDGVTHRCKKFILHTNFVDRPDFSQYHKCNFILASGGDHVKQSPQSGNPGIPSLLELPPTAVSHQNKSNASSMIGPGTADSSVTINLPASDETTSTSSAGGKKKKKNKAQQQPSEATAIISDSSTSPLTSMPRSDLVSLSPSLSPSLLPQSHATHITADSKWSDVIAVLGPCPSRPIISTSSAIDTKSDTTGGNKPITSANAAATAVPSHYPSLENPFSATLFYVYKGAVFEMMKNHHIASLTLFRE